MKKKLILVLVVVSLVVVGGLIGRTFQKDSAEKELEEYVEEEKTGEFVKISRAYTVSPSVSKEVREILEIKYTVDEDALEWGYLVIGIQVTNTSPDRPIDKVVFTLTIIDKAGNSHPEFEKKIRIWDRNVQRSIAPGETMDFSRVFGSINLKESSEKPEGFIVALEEVVPRETTTPSVSPAPSVTPSPTPQPGPAPTPSLTEESPGKIVKAYFEALKEDRYLEAEGYLSAEILKKLREQTTLKDWAQNNPNEIPIKVVIIEEEIDSEKEASVKIDLYLPNGEVRNGWWLDLVREDGAWKIKFD